MERGCMYIAKEETLWSGVGKGSEDQIGLPSLFMLCPFLPRLLGSPPSTTHDALQLRWMMLPFSPYHWKLPHLSCDRIPTSPFKLAIKRSKGRKNCFIFCLDLVFLSTFNLCTFRTSWIVPQPKNRVMKKYGV